MHDGSAPIALGWPKLAVKLAASSDPHQYVGEAALLLVDAYSFEQSPQQSPCALCCSFHALCLQACMLGLSVCAMIHEQLTVSHSRQRSEALRNGAVLVGEVGSTLMS